MVARELAETRGEAQRLIEEGVVRVGGMPAPKSSTLVGANDPIEIVSSAPVWASRAAHKLLGALDEFPIEVGNRRALDVGASTGGFTDVLLSRAAESVVAVDVGYGQLVWRLREDPRVTVVDRTNFRTVDVTDLGAPFDIVVVDVSFISVRLLADQLAKSGGPATDYVVLVKPQFEVGKDSVGKGGVVTDPLLHRVAVDGVIDALESHGVMAQGLAPSPILGTKGNQEFVLWANRSERSLTDEQVDEVVRGSVS